MERAGRCPDEVSSRGTGHERAIVGSGALLAAVAGAIDLARSAGRRIRENLAIALLYNAVAARRELAPHCRR